MARRRSFLDGVLLPGLAVPVILLPGCGPGVGSVPDEARVCDVAGGYEEEGLASWYGRPHHGRITASGQIFDMNELTAAHRSLPLGTRIRVTNTRNGRSVVLTVNDRGPFVADRILDVSYRAAQELGFVREGLARVLAEVVGSC